MSPRPLKRWSALFLLLLPIVALAENESTPVVDSPEEPWVETEFKKGDTLVTTRFKAVYPHPADKVWRVLIDTNSWKHTHSEYTDSRTLSRAQFDRVDSEKPTQVKAFYDMIGTESFPSELGRRPNQDWVSYVFQRFNLPWPLADRWVVIRIKNDENNAKSGRYRYEYRMAAGNFKDLKGYWQLAPVPGKPGWTEFSGEYRSDPGIPVPHFLAKKIFKASIRRTVKENIAVLDKQAGITPSRKK